MSPKKVIRSVKNPRGKEMSLSCDFSLYYKLPKSDPSVVSQVAGAWSERKKMFHGGSFLKLADDDV